MIATAEKAADAGATEVHIVGGLHPWLKFDYYLDMLRGIRAACPELHIKAFTAIEIIHFSRDRAHEHPRSADRAARSRPGLHCPAAARRFSTIACTMKSSKERCEPTDGSKCIAPPTSLGIYTNATMLYGHVETPAGAQWGI